MVPTCGGRVQLELKQPLLRVESAGESGEGAGGAHHAVAGTMIEMGLRPLAAPTARALAGSPSGPPVVRRSWFVRRGWCAARPRPPAGSRSRWIQPHVERGATTREVLVEFGSCLREDRMVGLQLAGLCGAGRRQATRPANPRRRRQASGCRPGWGTRSRACQFSRFQIVHGVGTPRFPSQVVGIETAGGPLSRFPDPRAGSRQDRRARASGCTWRSRVRCRGCPEAAFRPHPSPNRGPARLCRRRVWQPAR